MWGVSVNSLDPYYELLKQAPVALPGLIFGAIAMTWAVCRFVYKDRLESKDERIQRHLETIRDLERKLAEQPAKADEFDILDGGVVD